ncbi:TIGR00269 family protein [Candidatus Woesearchaeota archaeon]|nr:TIGR00269 family protein [Candidatus Woesearchaeota archaeon]
MRCSQCKAESAYKVPGKKLLLCSSHYVKWFENGVKATIKQHKLIKKGESVAVACSGGKDSTALLFILKKLGYKVEAVAVDEGIAGYREFTLKRLKKLCSKWDVRLKIYSFNKEYKLKIDEFGREKHICTICGVLRRQLLNKAAQGFDKIATGHNLDDEAQSILMNMCQANITALSRLGPITGVVEDAGFVPRVKPLYYCEEKQSAIYVMLQGFDVPRVECPYAVSSFRNAARAALNNYSQSNPKAKQQFVENFLKRVELLRKSDVSAEKIPRCKECGEPSSRALCHACYIKRYLYNPKE